MTENWTELYKKDRALCECEKCRNGKYDPKDYMLYEEEFLRLDQERPLGLTGHLRAKNEALSVGQCIESCIDFLDELIITYNDSGDETAEIIQKYADMYPNKIRAYHYKPHIINAYEEFFYNLQREVTKEEILEIFKGDTIKSNSIHNLANYYNFGYTKTSYKYYVKIDADQIYFTEKILKIKTALCNPWINYISQNTPTLLRRILNKVIKTFHIDSFLSRKNLSLLIKLLSFNKNTSFVLGGVNLFADKGEFVVPIKSNILWSSFFNGMEGDTAIWIPRSLSYYFFDEVSLWETIQIPCHHYQIGICWIHLNPIKNKVSLLKEVLKTCSLLELSNMTWDELYNPLFDNLLRPNNEWSYKHYKIAGEIFWDKDRKYITQEFYDKYFPSILEYYQKNIINN